MEGEVEGEGGRARDLLVGPLVAAAGVALPLRVWLVRGDTFRWKLEGALSDSLYLLSVLRFGCFGKSGLVPPLCALAVLPLPDTM